MYLKKLKLKNIRSYQDQEIEFPKGSLLLAGDIGSGKTSILLAIEYALFGLQPGQKGSALLRNNADVAEVSLEIEVQGNDILIERRLRRGAKSISNEYSAITVNGVKTESSTTEIKTKILSILGYPTEFIKRNNLLYRYTVYTPQEQMKQIILEDKESRLNILRHVFGIDKYKTIRENLSVLLAFLKEDSKFLQGEIRSLDLDKAKLLQLKNSTTELESQVFILEKTLLKKLEERKSIEKEAKALEDKIKEKESFTREIEKTRIMIASKQEALASLRRESEEIERTILQSKETFNEENYNQVIKNLEAKKIQLETLNAQYVDIIGQISSLNRTQKDRLTNKERIFKIDICPVCLQDVSENHKHNILLDTEKDLSEIKKKLQMLESNKTALVSFLKKAKEDDAALEKYKTEMEIAKTRLEYIDKSRLKLSQLTSQKEAFEKDTSFLNNHISSLKESVLNFSKYDHLYRIKQEDLQRALQDEKQTEISLAELRKEIELTKKQILDLSLMIENKEKSKEKLQNLLDLLDWLNNKFIGLVNFTERNVMLKLRLEFSKMFSKWFNILAGDSLDVQLDETFTPLIIQGETEMDYSFLSGGERTAVALAYRLALNQTINSILSQIRTRDLVILDEPTDGFSDAQIDKIRDVLQELNTQQLIIVSHEQKMEGFVDNVLRLRKSGEVSIIEQESLDTPKAENHKT